MARPSSAAPARPLFLVHGADGFRARLRAREIVSRLSRGDDPARSELGRASPAAPELPLGVVRLSARDAGLSEILLAVRSEGLFAALEGARVVLLEDAEAIADARVVREVPVERAVVLLAGAPLTGQRPARRAEGEDVPLGAAWLPALVSEAGGAVEEMVPLRDAAAAEWVRARAAARGARLSAEVAAALAAAVGAGTERGADLERAEREVEKLAAYADGGEITATSLRLLVPEAIEEDIFALTGAVVRRDVGTAIRVLERLFESGDATATALRVIGMLLWQFRVLLVALGARTDADLERAVRAAGLSKGAVLRARREARLLTRALVLRAYESLYAADMAIKGGRADARTALQLVVLDLSGVEGADLEPLAERPRQPR